MRSRFEADRVRSGRHLGHVGDMPALSRPDLVEWDDEHIRNRPTGPLVQVLSEKSGGDLAERYLSELRRSEPKLVADLVRRGGLDEQVQPAQPFEIAKLADGRGIFSRLEALRGVTWQVWANQPPRVRQAWFAMAVLDGCFIGTADVSRTSPEVDWSRPGGYTRSDVGILAGARSRSHQRRIRDRLISLGVLLPSGGTSSPRAKGHGMQPRFRFVGLPMPVNVSYEWHPGYQAMVNEAGRMARSFEIAWLTQLRDEARAAIRRTRRARPQRTFAEIQREGDELLDLPGRITRTLFGVEVAGSLNSGIPASESTP